MKKLLALAMALTLCLGLAACGGDTTDASTDTTDDTAQTGETVTLKPAGSSVSYGSGDPGAGGGRPG